MPTQNSAPPVILGRYAGFFSRGAAFTIDQAITFGIAFVIMVMIRYFFNLVHIEQWITRLQEVEFTNAIIAILLSTIGIHFMVSSFYNIGFWMLSGQTPGKRVLGVRVMRTDGGRLRFRNAVVR